jgi:signal transduction histidine kinase
MSIPPINLDSIMLAAQVAKVMNVIHRVAYALLSADLRVLYVSPNFASVLSEPTSNIYGRRIEELIWEFVGAEQSLEDVLSGKHPFLAFERINREMEDGRLLYLDITITPVDNPELVESGLLLIVEDVTEQAQMEQRLVQHRNDLLLYKEQLFHANEELQQLNRLKSLFLSMAVHDLRTPLTTIRAYSDLVLRLLPKDASPRLVDYITIVGRQAIRMDLLIDDFLDLDMLEQGKLKLKLERLDLNNIVEEVVEMIAYLAERRRQRLSLHLWPEALYLQLDPNRMQQILYNLLSNAIKYTLEEGRIVVSTRVDGETAVIQVADSGQGMDETQQASVFIPYYRTADADTYDKRGRGLGLYIVKMLTEAHGGRVDVTSKPEEGSTFYVYLPMEMMRDECWVKDGVDWQNSDLKRGKRPMS